MPHAILVKRFRMELRVRRSGPPAVPLSGFDFLPWADELVDAHAAVKYRAFAGEPDAELFPNLGSLTGCRLLMRAIRDHEGFCPGATWLVAVHGECVGTIQAIADDAGGMIQNVGVVPAFRGRGLGRALLAKAVAGLVAAGAGRVYLEVTADNAPAVAIYRRAGFRRVRTLVRGVG